MEAEEREAVRKFLKNVPVFKHLPQAYLKQISEDSCIHRFSKDEVVFSQNDESTDLYIVLDGRVKASFLNEDGDELVLAVFNKKEFFGDLSLLDGVPRSATITAEENSLLAVLKRDKFLDAIKRNPALAIDMLAVLAKRLRKADDTIEALVFLDAGQRLLKLMMELAESCEEKERRGFYRVRKLRHQELASRIGASRETVTKALKVLAVRKLIINDGLHYLIPSKAKNFADVLM